MTDRETRLRQRIDDLTDRLELQQRIAEHQTRRATRYRELARDRGASRDKWKLLYYAERRSKIKVAG